MNSFIQLITSPSYRYYTSGEDKAKWRGNSRGCNYFREYLLTLGVPDMIRFCIDQSVALSIFFWLYGKSAHEFAVSYSAWLKDFTRNVLGAKQMDANENALFIACKHIQDAWYGTDWYDVPIKLMATYVYQMTENERDLNIPLALTVKSFVPYLMHRNRKVQEECDVWPYEVELPRFEFNTRRWDGNINGFILTTGYRLGVGFTAKAVQAFHNDPQDIGTINQFRRSGLTLLEFIAKTNVTGSSFDTIIYNLTNFNLHFDQTRVTSANFQLCYATTAILKSFFSADFLDISKRYGRLLIEDAPNSDTARNLIALLGLLNRNYGVKVASREMFVRFFGAMCKDGKSNNDVAKVVSYVDHYGTNVASAEELSAYERSPLAGTEAIDFISQNATTPQDRVPDETEENPDDGEEENIDLSDLPELDDAEPSLEADQEPAEQDQDTSTDGDEGTDDPSSGEEESTQGDDTGDKSEEEDASGEDDPSSGDADGTGDAGADPGAGGNDTQPNAEPEDIDASDDDGISFEIAPEGSETVDSVVFREELDRFLSDVLANPPKKLSPQAVSALTVLQKQWVHILRVETIVGILEKIISLPEKFKTIKNLHGENS